MKNLKTILAATLSLTVVISAHASTTALAQSVFVDRNEVVYPIPTDADVIKPIGQPSRIGLSPERIKFLVWNLHKGSEDTFRYEYLYLGYDRDIIMNQEIFLDNNMIYVLHFMPHMFFTTATSFFDGKERVRTGVANASTVKPSSIKFVRTQILEPVLHSPKVTLITSYPILNTDKKLTVVNIHGINFVTTKSFQAEMSRIYEAIKNIPKPLVFAGDFNTWNKERMTILEGYKKKLGLSEAVFLPDNRVTFNVYPLDHFLHTSDIKVLNARVDKFYKGSDHKPLQVEVEYSPSESDTQESY